MSVINELLAILKSTQTATYTTNTIHRNDFIIQCSHIKVIIFRGVSRPSNEARPV